MSAHVRSGVRDHEVEDTASVWLSFACGALGSLIASDSVAAPWSCEATTGENPLYHHVREDCYRFMGTQGSLTFPSLDLWRYGGAGARGWQHPLQRVEYEVEPADPLVLQIEHFSRVVADGEPPLIDATEAGRTLAASPAILESSKTGRPIAVSDLWPPAPAAAAPP